jgi:RNA polymerase sigma-70 factor (ECF subfamily)
MVAPILPSVPSRSGGSAPPRTFRSVTSRQETLRDAALVHRFNAGDQAAFVEIVTLHRGKILGFVGHHLANPADAEEIAQDTFIRAYRGLAHFRGDSSLSVWLHSIALNLARSRYWYFFRRRRHVTVSIDRTIGDGIHATGADLLACDAPDPARAAVTREFSTLVAECMAQLNASQQEILLLCNVQQQTYRDIASKLGLSLGTVKSRIARARHSLRVRLARTYAGLATEPDSSPACPWFEPNRPAGASRLAP